MKNPKLVSLFKTVRRRIQTGQDRYICYAIESIPGVHHMTRKRARKLIRDRLQGHPIYEIWLLNHHPKVYWASYRAGTDLSVHKQNAKRGRVMWLNSLIKEFS